MKRHRIVLILSLTLILVSALAYLAFGEEHEAAMSQSSGFSIERLVVCESVQNREPVGEAEIFPSTIAKVYSFLEARDIVQDTSVLFVWYFEESVHAKVDLTLREGDRWRTYASKEIRGLRGNWKVEIQDKNGNILKAIAFRVE